MNTRGLMRMLEEKREDAKYLIPRIFVGTDGSCSRVNSPCLADEAGLA